MSAATRSGRDPAVIEIRRAGGPEERRGALDLRREVFVAEQGVSAAQEYDGRDTDAIHLVAVEGGHVVATCRLLIAQGQRAGPEVKLGRMAVSRSRRRRGIATELLRAAEQQARRLGARRIVLHAQTYTRTLYAQAGYRARGATFLEAGVEHIRMERPLA